MEDKNRKPNKLGQGIAFAGLCVCCAWMEVHGEGAGNLWLLVVLWAVCGFLQKT